MRHFMLYGYAKQKFSHKCISCFLILKNNIVTFMKRLNYKLDSAKEIVGIHHKLDSAKQKPSASFVSLIDNQKQHLPWKAH